MIVPYLNYFNLKEEPFNTTANPRFFYQSSMHSIALGKAEFTVDAKKGLSIVFGDTGYGKSTLARLLHGKFKEKGYISVLLTNPNYPTTNSLLRTIIQEFQLPKSSKAFKENLDIFKNYLFEQAVDNSKTIVLIIDEAQTLRIPLLELLRQIINYETNDMKLLQLVLFSQEQLRTKLTHPLARNFRSRRSKPPSSWSSPFIPHRHLSTCTAGVPIIAMSPYSLLLTVPPSADAGGILASCSRRR